MKEIILANKQDVDTLLTAFESIKRLATDKENYLGNKMTDEKVFNAIRAECIDAISYIKSSLNLDNND